MKFNKVLVAAFAAVCFSSCNKTFYQVYDVESKDLKLQDNSMVYENDDCKVLYNLWSNNGELKFVIWNKTDKDIYINLAKTFYEVNGKANEYFRNRIYSSSVANSISTTAGNIWGNNIFLALLGSKTQTVNTVNTYTIEKEIVCIPAKCYKEFNTYKLSPSLTVTCTSKQDFPSESSKIKSYTEQDTPYTFSNRIAYNFSNDSTNYKYIDNKFWVSNITNYSRGAATEDKTSKCYFKTTSRIFKVYGPDKFYVTYFKDGINY